LLVAVVVFVELVFPFVPVIFRFVIGETHVVVADSPLLLHIDLLRSVSCAFSHEPHSMSRARERCAAFPNNTGSIRSPPRPSIRNRPVQERPQGQFTRTPRSRRAAAGSGSEGGAGEEAERSRAARGGIGERPKHERAAGQLRRAARRWRG